MTKKNIREFVVGNNGVAKEVYAEGCSPNFEFYFNDPAIQAELDKLKKKAGL